MIVKYQRSSDKRCSYLSLNTSGGTGGVNRAGLDPDIQAVIPFSPWLLGMGFVPL